jgi:hypothetical protein
MREFAIEPWVEQKAHEFFTTQELDELTFRFVSEAQDHLLARCRLRFEFSAPFKLENLAIVFRFHVEGAIVVLTDLQINNGFPMDN